MHHRNSIAVRQMQEKADAHAFRYFIFKEMGNSEEAKKERDLAKSMNPNLDIQQRRDCMKQKELKFDIEKINDMKKSLSDSADDLNTYKDKVIQSLDKLKKDYDRR